MNTAIIGTCGAIKTFCYGEYRLYLREVGMTYPMQYFLQLDRQNYRGQLLRINSKPYKDLADASDNFDLLVGKIRSKQFHALEL